MRFPLVSAVLTACITMPNGSIAATQYVPFAAPMDCFTAGETLSHQENSKSSSPTYLKAANAPNTILSTSFVKSVRSLNSNDQGGAALPENSPLEGTDRQAKHVVEANNSATMFEFKGGPTFFEHEKKNRRGDLPLSSETRFSDAPNFASANDKGANMYRVALPGSIALMGIVLAVFGTALRGPAKSPQRWSDREGS